MNVRGVWRGFLRFFQVGDWDRPLPQVEIDLNVRVRGDETYSGFEDVTGPIRVGPVIVFESESGLVGSGRITEIDEVKRVVYLTVRWRGLRPRRP